MNIQPAVAAAAAATYSITSMFLQAVPSVDSAERIVTGAGVAGAAATVVWFTLRYSKQQQTAWTEILAAEQARGDRLEHELAEITARWETERRLRLQLEERGLADRRRPTIPNAGDQR